MPAVRPLCLLSLLPFLAAGCDPDNPQPPAAEIWLESGTGPGQTVYPRAITHDPINHWFYIVDRQGRIQRLSPTGLFLNGWTVPDGRLGKPVGLSVGPDGLLYVPDTHYHRVLVFTPDGTEVRRWGALGTGPGQFTYPTDIAFHNNRIFVAEYGDNDRIQVFTPQGEFLYQFGSFGREKGQFSRPQSLAFIGDELFVADACNHRIQVFTPQGQHLRTLGQLGSAPGELRFPYGLEPTPQGHLLVTEFGNNRIQRLHPATGQSLATWGSPGRGPNQLAHPWAATPTPTGLTVIADSGNNRLLVVGF